MKSVVRHVTVNCGAPHEPYDLALFWSQVLGHPVHPEDKPGDDEVGLEPPAGQGPTLLFIRVPDAKPDVRNRVHLDLQPDLPREAEVERLLAAGASLVDDRRTEDGKGWVVLADPAGNEFCVERSAAEREAAKAAEQD
ncbi:putative enzyme related to lactoylglutathione lyase [Crossiella equi]|uniref:Enzyme related to lactoylglutathione lyase n=1 Tax=Crossiella equi TaxID=130796 RepID=A0ABS5AN76_9PSEU|nr:VOC family protein [Crossiella equi]MBP2478021.1 putative enzyme related to lactoylglutathione lyase [Crossiella equi]